MSATGVSMTGLIEARRNPLARRFDQRDEDVDFGDIVRRPPIAWRPFAFIRSPYRYGCSILCNHPVDPEFRGALRDKETWFSECRSPLTKEDYDRIQYMIHHIRTGSRAGSEFGDDTSCEQSRRNSRLLSLTPSEGVSRLAGCRRNGNDGRRHVDSGRRARDGKGNNGLATLHPNRAAGSRKGGTPSVKISRPSSAVVKGTTPTAEEEGREEFVVDLLNLRRSRSFDALSTATIGTNERDQYDGATDRSFASDDCFRIDIDCIGNDRREDDGSKRRVVARLFGERCRSSSADSTEGQSLAASALMESGAGNDWNRNSRAQKNDRGAALAIGEKKLGAGSNTGVDGKYQKTPQKVGPGHRGNASSLQQPLPYPTASQQLDPNNKRKLKVKRKKRSTSPEKEYKDAALEAETQMKSLEASGITKSSEGALEKGPGDGNNGLLTGGKTNGSSGKHVTFQSSLDLDDYLIQQQAMQQGERGIQQKQPQSDDEFDYDTLRGLQAQLKEGIRVILTKGATEDMHQEIEALRKELARRKGGDPPDALIGNPRVYDKSLVRYELPMDIKKLEGLTPLQYIEEYSFVSESLKNLHARVYKRHRDLQPTGKFSFRALTVAMTEIMGQGWSPDDSDAICKILGVSVQKTRQGAKADSVLAAMPGNNTGTPGGTTASEISKGSSPSQHSALKEPAKTMSSRQSTDTSVGHQSHPSPPGSPTISKAPAPRLIDLLNAGRERRTREQKLAEQARKESVPDITALRASKFDPTVPVTSLDLNQFHAVAALAERLFCPKYAKIGNNVIKDKEYVEIADFERLQEKLGYVCVSDELRNLLLLIKTS